MAYSEKLADRVRDALGVRNDVREQKMFGGIAFMVHGHMACGIVGETLMLRLPVADADGYLKEPHVRVMDFTGHPMRGFLFVDPPAIKSGPGLRKWVSRAASYAESQPPKPAKRRAPILKPRRPR